MAITKTDFINYTRCSRFSALNEVYKEKLDADISYEDYKNAEEKEIIEELLSSMYEENEDNLIDLVNIKNAQLEAMLPYYKQVEIEAGKFVEKYFKGKTIYSENTKRQECFDFSLNGILYKCYVDIYNESNNNINIIEVKSTTSKKFWNLKSKNGEIYNSIFVKKDNIYYLKDEVMKNLDIDEKKYYSLRNKLFDRYGVGKYVYDLAVQRYFIEGEYKSSHNEKKLNNFKYYLAVLNHEYIFDGTYHHEKPLYNKDENGNELIVLFDLTKITQEYMQIIDKDRIFLENYLKNNNASVCKLGKYCERNKPGCCKFFNPVCSKIIPKKNSSLNYIMNGQGFKNEYGDRIKGLDLINEGYINLLDVPESFITREIHHIQRDCLTFNKEYIDKEKIIAGLKELKYPIYHLDFETFPCPLPRFKGEFPYIQSPFEFSLHIERAPGVCDKDKDNYVFLAKTMNDEREELVKAMLKYMDPNQGTLFAQNVAFEKGRIKELANIFPEYKKDLMKLYDRGFDLLWLINTNSKLYQSLGFDENRSKIMNYYNNALSGSFSIKKTLPVFSNLKYDDLDVKNGTEAIVAYANYKNMSKEEYELKYQALITYCKQDTWAMVVILNALRKLVETKHQI